MWVERGIRVIGIVGERPQPVERLRTKRGIAFPILIDSKRDVIKRYDVYQAVGLDGGINVARPAIFVLDASGIARWVYVGRDRADRPSIEQIDAVLARLPTSSTTS